MRLIFLLAIMLLAGCGGDGGSSDTSDPRTFGLDPGGDTTIICDNEGDGSQVCFDGDGNRVESPSDDDSDDDVTTELPEGPAA